jgi:predicted Zn-dependent peptidase
LKLRTSRAFQDQGLLNRAMNLAYFELLGSAQLINEEAQKYQHISTKDLQAFALQTFRKTNCSRLIIQSQQDAK